MLSPSVLLIKGMQKISFREHILPLKDKLYRLALRMTMNREEAEDIVQETLVKAWRKQIDWQHREEARLSLDGSPQHGHRQSPGVRRYATRAARMRTVQQKFPIHGCPTLTSRSASVNSWSDSLSGSCRSGSVPCCIFGR